MRVNQIEALISTTKEEVFGQVERRDKSALLKGVNEWLDGSITMDGDAKLQQRSYDGKNLLPGNTMQ